MRPKIRSAAFLFLGASLLMGQIAIAQTKDDQPNTPFSLLGYIQELKLTSDPRCGTTPSALRGGEIVVNGMKVTIPCNLIVLLPGTFLSLEDIFRGPIAKDAAAPVLADSGLALKPNATNGPVPSVPFEAQVSGNIVNGEYIAGLVKITQQDLNVGAGFINKINAASGELEVTTMFPAPTGAQITRVRVNDPEGVYYAKPAQNTGHDFRFTSDSENPTLHAETGYPLCIPTDDEALNADRCPKTNRPKATSPNEPNQTKNGFLTRFTLGTVPAAADAPAICNGCKPDKKAPLQVGDYINFSGTLMKDSVGGFYISAHTISSAIGIFTSPCPGSNPGCANPAYIGVEDVLFATGGWPWTSIAFEAGPNTGVGARTRFDQEVTTMLKVVAFETDPSRSMSVYAADPQADGTEVCRKLTTSNSNKPFGRVVINVGNTNLLPPPKEVIISNMTDSLAIGASGPCPSGVVYRAPVGEFIFAENTVYGQPLIPMNFENLCFLKGGGRYEALGRDSSGPIIGPLIPFPESSTPPRKPQPNPVCR